jgi:hypoxanthine phosphoribosyltransferase
MAITPQEAQQVLEQADCCYTRPQVEAALDRLAVQISEEYQNKNPLLLCVMSGGLIITGELLLRLQFPLQYDYIHATRYAGKTRGGELNWIAESSIDLAGRNVLIVDDINDEGITLSAIVNHCRKKGAATVRSVVLVEKQHDRKYGVAADFVGLEIDDRYVFGYGMDYHGYLRNVPGIYAVKGT